MRVASARGLLGDWQCYRDISVAKPVTKPLKEAQRKQGIGRTIVRELQDIHRPPLWLTCRSELRSFYEASGFVEIKGLDDMPPYFRRAKRFATLIQTLTRRKIRLAVMVYDSVAQSA